MANVLPSIISFVVDRKATIGYSFIALLTIGGEAIFSKVSFQCPCNRDQNFAYGLTFLLGPAAVLLILGLFFSTSMWRLCTGCCLHPMKLCPKDNRLKCPRVILSIFTGACVAPLMWLCAALLNGTFYECAVSGVDNSLVVDLFCKNKTFKCQEELSRVPCVKLSKLHSDERTELLLMLSAQSQILGWCLLIIAASIGLIGTCYTNCCSKVSYLQRTFWKRYVQKEKKLFDEFTVKYAKKLAERNLESFFDKKDPEKFPFPDQEAWEKISALYTFTRSMTYYSTLDKYVGERGKDRPEGKDRLDLESGMEMSLREEGRGGPREATMA